MSNKSTVSKGTNIFMNRHQRRMLVALARTAPNRERIYRTNSRMLIEKDKKQAKIAENQRQSHLRAVERTRVAAKARRSDGYCKTSKHCSHNLYGRDISKPCSIRA